MLIRYIRDWVSGSNISSTNIWSEIEAFDKYGTNVALNKTVTTPGTVIVGTLAFVTNGLKPTNGSGYVAVGPSGLQHVVVDLGDTHDILSIVVSHFFNTSEGGRIFNSTKTEVSADGLTWYTVFDSSVRGTYIEPIEGKVIHLEAIIANSINRVSKLDQVIDRNTSPDRKWFSLHNNKLDGSFYPVPFTTTEVLGDNSAVNPYFNEGFYGQNVPTSWLVWGVGGTFDIAEGRKGNGLRVSVSTANGGVYQRVLSVTAATRVYIKFIFKGDRPTYPYLMKSAGGNYSLDGLITYTSLEDDWTLGEVDVVAGTASSVGFMFAYNTVASGILSEVYLSDKPFTMPVNEVGHWGATLSDSSGSFPTAQTLTLTYDTLQSFGTLRLAGDELLNEFPVSFSLRLYKNNVLQHTETVTDNDQVHWKKQLANVIDADKLEVSVTKINRPNSVVKIVEASELWERARKDSLSLKANDVKKPLDMTIKRKDTLRTLTIETSKFPYLEVWRKDNLTIKEDIVDTVKASFKKTDNIVVSPSESDKVTASMSSVDSGKFNVTERDNITARIPRTDMITLIGLDSSDPVHATTKKTDSLTIKSVDTKEHPKVNFSTRDAMVIKAAETDFIIASMKKKDSAIISQSVEDDAINAAFDSTDDIRIKVSDTSIVTNIHTVMNEPFRQVFGKVEIVYTDPFIDATIEVESSPAMPYTSAGQTADNVNGTRYKTFVLGKNKLDGTFYPIDNEGSQSLGFWSVGKSDALGRFADPVWLRVLFEPRPISSLKIVGDDKLNEFPTDFAITLYGQNDEVLYEHVVTDNTKVHWEINIPVVIDVVKMYVEVNAINVPNSSARITEFYTAVKEVYEGEDIVFMNLLEEQTFDNMSLPIGNISANELDIRLLNRDNKFTGNNKNSKLYGLLRRNRKITAWLGAEVVPGKIEWHQLGVFWSQDWKAPTSGVWAETSGLDNLDLMRQTEFTESVVYKDVSLHELACTVLKDYGLKSDQYIIEEALKDITLPYAWFDKVSHREALSQIATAALGRVYCDRYGRIVITVFDPIDEPMAEFDEDTNLIDVDMPLAWSQIKNHIEVTSSPRQESLLLEIYSTTEPIVVPANAIIEETYPFSNSPVLDVRAPDIVTPIAGVSVKDFKAYSWGIVVTYENTTGTEAIIDKVTIQGRELQVAGMRIATAADTSSVRDNGKNIHTLESPFIQSFARAQQIADQLLLTYKDPRHDASLVTRGDIALTLGHKIEVPVEGHKQDFFIIRQSLNWDGALDATIQAQKIGG